MDVSGLKKIMSAIKIMGCFCEKVAKWMKLRASYLMLYY